MWRKPRGDDVDAGSTKAVPRTAATTAHGKALASVPGFVSENTSLQ